MRQKGETKGALPSKHQYAKKGKKKKKKNLFTSGEDSTASHNKSKVAISKRSYPPCKHCGKKGHPLFKCWKRPKARCNKCNQLGHEAIICKNKSQQKEAGAQIVDGEEEYQLFVATCFSGIESSEGWLIDSGCTNHMKHDKALFKELRSTNKSKVRIGNGQYIAVEGKGTIAILSCSGTKFIYDVLYALEIDQNLLSVGQLIEKGYKVVFEDKSYLIKDLVGQDNFRVKMIGKSFALNPLEDKQIAFPIRENITKLWHKRLGHWHYQGLIQMESKMMQNDLPDLDDHIPDCKACQFTKKRRKPFPEATWRASKNLQLIHTDIAGPQRTPSLKGRLYYVAFINDCTRMCWIYFFKYKSKVAQVLCKFKAKVENESGCRIQTVISDNGKEYISESFNRFREEAGIQH